MKSRYLLAGLASAALIGFAMPAVSADSPQDFVTKAANGGMFEVESSKLAVEEGGKDVQGFAQKMITDHGTANAKLQEIAKEQKLSIPAELDAKHKADLDALKGPSETFDASYVKMQRDAHSDAVALFESYAKEGDNAALKTFAQETVPTSQDAQGGGRQAGDRLGFTVFQRRRNHRRERRGTGPWRQQFHTRSSARPDLRRGLLGRLRARQG